MKFKLHRPNRNLWSVALVLFIIGVMASVAPVPVLSEFAFPMVVISAALLLLGTWVI